MSAPDRLFQIPPPGRQIFCNRTLNLRGIKAIGYDMDYTLVHYHVSDWEESAYHYVKEKLDDRGWPIGDLRFDSSVVMRGCVIDRELGNVVQANRFGYVKRAYHGTKLMSFEDQRKTYQATRVDLSLDRFQFLSTLFSLSEGCLYLQMVDLLDARKIDEPWLGYSELWQVIREATDTAHMEGRLKAEILANPERYIVKDAEAPLALLDQRAAGKKLLLITNSEWHYTQAVMTFAFDEWLPGDMKWRDLFDLVVVGARKPSFFTDRSPAFEVVSEDGLLRTSPHGVEQGTAYLGASAAAVENGLGLTGSDILYVGDHIYSDVSASKKAFSWRTALVMRELEDEVAAVNAFEASQERLDGLMLEKEALETEFSQARLAALRHEHDHGPKPDIDAASAKRVMSELRTKLVALDGEIAALAKDAAQMHNEHWGLLMRAGNDKSLLARQVERWADIYTSRVANFLHETPFVYLRAPTGSLPHDRAFRRDALP